jgi:hypothetical protein
MKRRRAGAGSPDGVRPAVAPMPFERSAAERAVPHAGDRMTALCPDDREHDQGQHSDATLGTELREFGCHREHLPP